MARDSGEKPGLQAERTELSWERTSIGFLVTAAVVLFRFDGPLGDGRTSLAIVSLSLALATLAIGQSRARMFVKRDAADKPAVPHAAAAVRFVGLSTACLAVLIALFVILTVGRR